MLPKRSLAERTFAWLRGYHWLSKYKKSLLEISEAMVRRRGLNSGLVGIRKRDGFFSSDSLLNVSARKNPYAADQTQHYH